MTFQVPEGAKLDPKVREALRATREGGVFDPAVLMPHLVDKKIVEADAKRLESAKAWTAKNADCLTCGACCQQGWRVDVRASDFPRMSEATKARMVEVPPEGALSSHVVGVLRIIDGEPLSSGKRCAAQTTHNGCGCDIYEERPETCRTFEVGHERCVVLRAERGLPFEPEDDGMGPPYFGTDNGW